MLTLTADRAGGWRPGYGHRQWDSSTHRTREEMRPVIRHVKDKGGVKIVVGGAAVTREFADEIGADGFGVDASDAVRAVRESLGLSARG